MSTISLSSYINFQGKAREALEFYQSVLGGELALYAVDDEGDARPAEPGDRIKLGRLEAEGAVIFATDGHPKFPAQVGENMAIMLSGTEKERIRALFAALAEGGKVKGRLTLQPWGGETGYLADKFGVNWIVRLDVE
jgi:PhnB protein